MAEEKNQNEIALYIAADGSMQLDVRIDAETVWLTQRQMAELFDTSSENVIMHLKNIYGDANSTDSAIAKDYLTVRTEAVARSNASSGILILMPSSASAIASIPSAARN